MILMTLIFGCFLFYSKIIFLSLNCSCLLEHFNIHCYYCHSHNQHPISPIRRKLKTTYQVNCFWITYFYTTWPGILNFIIPHLFFHRTVFFRTLRKDLKYKYQEHIPCWKSEGGRERAPPAAPPSIACAQPPHHLWQETLLLITRIIAGTRINSEMGLLFLLDYGTKKEGYW